jgi:hypothetical protein
MVVLLVDSLAKEFPFLVRWFYLLNRRPGSLTSVFFLFFCAEFFISWRDPTCRWN